jgi:hypothetical protein
LRFYTDGSVPIEITDRLKGMKAEIVTVDNTKGRMFWRFLVADDPTVHR